MQANNAHGQLLILFASHTLRLSNPYVRLFAKVRSMEEQSFVDDSDSEIIETASNNSLSAPTTEVSEPAGREQHAVQVCSIVLWTYLMIFIM